MDYIRTDENGQLVFEQSTEFLQIPSCLFGFHNTETIVGKAVSGRTVYCFQGELDLSESERRCECGKRIRSSKGRIHSKALMISVDILSVTKSRIHRK